MQSANISAMQNGRFTDCITRTPRQLTGAMNDVVTVNGRRIIPSPTGEAMGESVLVNGRPVGPSPRPYITK